MKCEVCGSDLDPGWAFVRRISAEMVTCLHVNPAELLRMRCTDREIARQGRVDRKEHRKVLKAMYKAGELC